MPSTSIRFGVELELILGHRQDKEPFAKWDDLAKDVSRRLSRAGISNHIHDKKNGPEKYKEWFIIREVTIKTDPASYLYGIELVSPVFKAEGTVWGKDLQTIFDMLHSNYAVHTSETCSTHVHLSTAGNTLSAAATLCLAEAILYYEHAIDALMPDARVGDGSSGAGSYWCASNRMSHMFSGGAVVANNVHDYIADMAAAQHAQQPVPAAAPTPFNASASLDTCLDIVRACYNSGLFSMDDAMNLFTAKSVIGMTRGKKADFVHGKVFKWNFGNLYETSSSSSQKTIKSNGTVEFRQCPGSESVDEAWVWITLALAFFAGVLSSDGDLLGGTVTGASVAELEVLLQRGGQVLGWGHLGALQEVLQSVAGRGL
ncbi:hypothetical protein Sste5346_005084 [Sporothrix stenoceras]|uniref:Amidoligase enzyme n=1 Tax=Sporothrix stenoceras TaxID=5173 RepID=A0ABR3Z4Q7_9PEZI